MKTKIGLLGLLLILPSAGLNARVASSSGIKIGAVSASQTWDYSALSDPDFKSRLGLDVGLFVEAFDLRVASVLLEAHYVQKGFSDEQVVTGPDNPDGTGEILEISPRVDYLSFPLLLKVDLPLFLSPYLLAGPRLDLRIGQKPEGYQAVLDDLERLDTGVTVGVGIEPLPLSPANIVVEIRYSPGFREIFDNGNLTVKNKSLEFLVGVGF